MYRLICIKNGSAKAVNLGKGVTHKLLPAVSVRLLAGCFYGCLNRQVPFKASLLFDGLCFFLFLKCREVFPEVGGGFLTTWL